MFVAFLLISLCLVVVLSDPNSFIINLIIFIIKLNIKIHYMTKSGHPTLVRQQGKKTCSMQLLKSFFINVLIIIIKKVSYAQQGCIGLVCIDQNSSKNYIVKLKITFFYFNIF